MARQRILRISHIKHVIGRKADGLCEIDLFLDGMRSLCWLRSVPVVEHAAGSSRPAARSAGAAPVHAAQPEVAGIRNKGSPTG